VAATEAQRDSVPARELFHGWLHHARLSGELQSYRMAKQALDELTDRVGRDNACPEQAVYALATHRPAAAAAALDHCTAAASVGQRADIAYYQGQYRQALELARQALNESATPDNFIRLSRLRMATGSPHEAAALMEAAQQRYHNDSPHQLAWFKLQRGLIALHCGEFERARAFYTAALQELDGWWLAEEHLAEVQLLLRERDKAQALYDAVIDKTGYPEFLEARAKLYEEAGDATNAHAMIDLARARFEANIALLPEAAIGHAIPFYLSYGPPGRSLELARSEYANRSDGDTALLLSMALLANGEAESAIQTVESQLAAGWDTAEAHYLLAMAYEKQGETALSTAHRRQAMLLNPRVDALVGTLPPG
jgi:tetratricopeptide (TPR) repeat protein